MTNYKQALHNGYFETAHEIKEFCTDRQLLAAGICTCCGEQPLAHGPWTDEQIEAACTADGYEVEHFEDWCNTCMLEHVFLGDREFAAKHGCVVAEVQQ